MKIQDYKKIPLYFNEHFCDQKLYQGYDYENEGVFKNVLSPELFSNQGQWKIYRQIEKTFIQLINSVKHISHHLMFSLDKNEVNQIR